MTDKKISQLTDGGAFRTTDEFPAVRDGANVRVNLEAAEILTEVYTDDLVLLVRDGVTHWASVSSVLAATSPAPSPSPSPAPSPEPEPEYGQFDFSGADNSAYAAII